MKYPVSSSYQKAFLKHIIKTLESQHEIEIHDDIYEQLCHHNNLITNEWAYKHYVINDKIITIKQSNSFISHGTTGLCSWQASIALSEWALCNKREFQDAHVLELGSGTGLLGFIVGTCCAPQKLCLSDCHPNVLRLLNENLHINESLNDSKLGNTL